MGPTWKTGLFSVVGCSLQLRVGWVREMDRNPRGNDIDWPFHSSMAFLAEIGRRGVAQFPWPTALTFAKEKRDLSFSVFFFLVTEFLCVFFYRVCRRMFELERFFCVGGSVIA